MNPARGGRGAEATGRTNGQRKEVCGLTAYRMNCRNYSNSLDRLGSWHVDPKRG